jgi:hypothetical protein
LRERKVVRLRKVGRLKGWKIERLREKLFIERE